EDFWNSIGITVFQGYGLTETSPVVSCNTPRERKEHSAGKVIPQSGPIILLCKQNQFSNQS
ncbi:unnamed protein product, partial [marine sediment metagenome]